VSKSTLWFPISVLTLLCSMATAQQLQPSAPAVVAAVAPQWPSLGLGIKKANEESSRVTATVEVTIDDKGTVTAAKPLKAHPLFQNTSLEAARRWRFAPGENGRIAQLTFSFVVWNRGAARDQLGTIFLPPYEIEVRVELPESSVLP